MDSFIKVLSEMDMESRDPESLLDYNEVPEGWNYEVAYNDKGEDVAILIHSGTEVHFNVNPAHKNRVFLRKVTRQLSKPVLDKYGFMTTKMPKGDENIPWLEAMGFQKTWEMGEFECFICIQPPYTRTKNAYSTQAPAQ